MDREFLSGMAKIHNIHATIDELLARDEIADSYSENPVGKWFIKEYYSGEDCNFGLAVSDEHGKTTFPLHTHPFSKEYLICVEGKVLLHIGDSIRILEAGDCACLPKGISHYSKPFGGKAKLVYICVPVDKTFNRDRDNG